MNSGDNTDRFFLQESARLIHDLLSRIDRFDPDEIEAESSEGVVKLGFADGTKCVLNRQSAARQIWLAEGSRAWHFSWESEGRTWMDTKGRGPLWRILAEILSHRLGRTIDLS